MKLVRCVMSKFFSKSLLKLTENLHPKENKGLQPSSLLNFKCGLTTTVLLMCTATLHELNVNGILIQCTCMTCTLCVITRTYMHAYMHVHVNQSTRPQ